MTFDNLLTISDNAKHSYAQASADKLIASAPEPKRESLRQLQDRLDSQLWGKSGALSGE